MGVTKPISSVPLFSEFFQYYQSTRYLLNITLIFDRCHRSSAVVTPVKYKCDSDNLRATFARTKILLKEKITNGALVTPTPGVPPMTTKLTSWRLIVFREVTDAARPGVGWLNQFLTIHYFSNFSVLSKHMLAIEYHVRIWQVSPQHSCGDTCQTWTWFKDCNRYFSKIENFAYGEINGRSLSNPHPQLELLKLRSLNFSLRIISILQKYYLD